jgi:hypothetical protein
VELFGFLGTTVEAAGIVVVIVLAQEHSLRPTWFRESSFIHGELT